MSDLSELLKQLRLQMQKSAELAPFQREKLGKIEQSLTAHIREEGNKDGISALIEEITTAVEEFEEHHPTITEALNRIMNMLSSIGI